MKTWYRQYWAQTWYRNTFLVNQPHQIARSTIVERDWNNIHDSGCNFVCLAMIINIDPAMLASLLSEANFFAADKTLPAKYLTGKKGLLVWDINEPGLNQAIHLHEFWHCALRKRVSISLSLVQLVHSMDYPSGRKVVERALKQHHHVVCGPSEHSHLVAGKKGGDYIIWDPDDSEKNVEDTLKGRFTLNDLYDDYPDEPIEFWIYKLNVTSTSAH